MGTPWTFKGQTEESGASCKSRMPPQPVYTRYYYHILSSQDCWGVAELSHQLFSGQSSPGPSPPTHGIHHFLLEQSPSYQQSGAWTQES